ncbi:MAG: hypothetical protein OEZ48_00595 [Candidatus Bathyarchaeota archaeon]|nr:hypothetical protein [Candidatus Bathyarchaeota archaeon]MDH5686355.1 hypothetical protein [Candidatus Bathyarchaeota archaeon]
MKCRICGRESTSGFCELHEMAYDNLLEGYKDWKNALNLAWTSYLRKVMMNPNTGLWAKEVAQELVSESSGRNQDPESNS